MDGGGLTPVFHFVRQQSVQIISISFFSVSAHHSPVHNILLIELVAAVFFHTLCHKSDCPFSLAFIYYSFFRHFSSHSVSTNTAGTFITAVAMS